MRQRFFLALAILVALGTATQARAYPGMSLEEAQHYYSDQGFNAALSSKKPYEPADFEVVLKGKDMHTSLVFKNDVCVYARYISMGQGFTVDDALEILNKIRYGGWTLDRDDPKVKHWHHSDGFGAAMRWFKSGKSQLEVYENSFRAARIKYLKNR